MTAIMGILVLAAGVASAAPPSNKAVESKEAPSADRESALVAARKKADRAEMVLPAPTGFKPRTKDKALVVRLVARDKVIRVGETFWYRIELQNVGGRPVLYSEKPSFLKNGMRYDMGLWDFEATLPDGTTKALVIGTLAEEWGMAGRPRYRLPKEEEERQWIDKDLEVTLAPGETLVSRPWRWVDAQEAVRLDKAAAKDRWPRPPGVFSELWSAFKFRTPGTYRIRVRLNDPIRPPATEEEVKLLARPGEDKAVIRSYISQLRDLCLGVHTSNDIELRVAQ